VGKVEYGRVLTVANSALVKIEAFDAHEHRLEGVIDNPERGSKLRTDATTATRSSKAD
jgi:hypothetical protein